jgi:hypothetical protein
MVYPFFRSKRRLPILLFDLILRKHRINISTSSLVRNLQVASNCTSCNLLPLPRNPSLHCRIAEINIMHLNTQYLLWYGATMMYRLLTISKSVKLVKFTRRILEVVPARNGCTAHTEETWRHSLGSWGVDIQSYQTSVDPHFRFFYGFRVKGELFPEKKNRTQRNPRKVI